MMFMSCPRSRDSPQDLAEKVPLFPCRTESDRDSIFCPAVVGSVKALGTEPSRTAYWSPWQNPVAERWIGTLRRELLDHVVVLGRHHLVQLVTSFIRYYHADRCHLGLERDTPEGRPVTPRPAAHATVVALPRVGGLHHRYVWREAA
jgi:hypothetical protein